MDQMETTVDSGRVGGAPVAAWRRLYDVAMRLRALDPWQWMTLGHLFGVQPHGAPEPFFVLFSELVSSSRRMVAVFSGWMAFRIAFANNSDDERPALEKTVEESWMRLLFAPPDTLARHDKAVLGRLGLLDGSDGEVPFFYSQHVGYFPDRLGADEVVTMHDVLYQAYGMAMRVESAPTLTQQRLPHTFLVRTQDGSGSWRDAWVDEPDRADGSMDVGIEMQQVKRLGGFAASKRILQADLVLTPLRTRSRGNHRSEAVFTLVLIDRESKDIVCCEAMQAIEGFAAMWARVPGLVLSAIERLGVLPLEIEVRSDRMFNILRPLTEFLSFKLRRRETLAVIEGVSASIERFI